jgi:hypothetical protein
MKIAVAFILMLTFMVPVAGADEETLLSGQIEHGGFGGPVVKFTELKDEFAVLVGGRGGWLINHTFSIGGGGYALVNQSIDERVLSPETTIFMTMGYGGLELEYIANSNNLVHMTLSALVGGGGIDYMMKSRHGHWDESDYLADDADAFFVVEPAINGELNVLKYFRVDVGLSYRFISGIETDGISDNDLSGLAGNIALKFGKF